MADSADPEATTDEQPPEKEEAPIQDDSNTATEPAPEEPAVVEQSNEGNAPSSQEEGTEVEKEEAETSEGQQQIEEPPLEAPLVEESASNEQDKQTGESEGVTDESAPGEGVTGENVTSEAGDDEREQTEETEQLQDSTAPQETDVVEIDTPQSEEDKKESPLMEEDQEASAVQSADTVEEEEEERVLHRPTVLEGIMEDEGDEEEEEEELLEEEVLDREEAIETYKSLLTDQERLNTQNAQLQHKIAEYLARKKTDERTDPARNTTDQEQRYLKCLEALGQLQSEMMILQEDFISEEQQLKKQRQHKQERVEHARAEFESYVREKAITAVHSRTGKKLSLQMVNDYLSQLERKDLEVRQVRLENIKLHNKIAQHETLIKKKEQLAEGLHMIDFEQLKINNVDLNEKIEDRNEEILKLRKKVTSTVQVLAHLKEKLQFVQAESSGRETRLKELDEVVAQKRDQLTRLKHVRDAIRSETVKLKQKGGLIGHTTLLRDMEDRQEQGVAMREQLHHLQQQYTELTLKCDGLRRKIDQTKTLQNRY